MRDPAFYPHETQSPINVIQTHISFVVLTGQYAYKIKKPVDLGFLDFTTLEQRQHYCQEEVRLNQEFSPTLYLKVVPIFGQNGHFSLDNPNNEGSIVEYAVLMRQFSQDDLLINVFERGEIDLEFVERLGTRIARIHQNAVVVDSRGNYGSADAMAASVQMNFEPIQHFSDTLIPSERFDSLRTYLEQYIKENTHVFEQRVANKCIRECHGDLHLSNICIYIDSIELFDRIEFNNEFKNIDRMYDIAFLLMDLRYRGKPDLANRLMNTYLELSGDYRGAQLLPFYQSVRALIRAEVALLLSTDTELADTDQAVAREEGIRYFEYALGATQVGPGQLFVTCGPSGTGKSTIARSLALHLDAIHIRSDAVRKHLSGVGLTERNRDIYTDDWNSATYSELIDLGTMLVEKGNNVVLDATFARRSLRNALIDSAGSKNQQVTFIQCTVPLAIRKSRVAKRQSDVSDATEQLITGSPTEFEEFTDAEQARRILLDTQDDNAFDVLLQELDGN